VSDDERGSDEAAPAWLAAAEVEGRRLGLEMGAGIAKGVVELVKAKAEGERLLAAAWAERDRALEERDQACADLAKAVEEREALRGDSADWQRVANEWTERTRAAEAERDRLRAVLDAGERNVDAVAAGLPSTVLVNARLATWAVIASLRRRAGLEP